MRLLIALWFCLIAQIACQTDWYNFQNFIIHDFKFFLISRYYKHWCGHGLQYLDDAKCAKVFPSKINREWSCPLPTLQSAPEGYELDKPFTSVSVDTTSLSKYVNDSAINLCVILTKRVANISDSKGYSIYNKYYCAGDNSANTGYETWSR
jgi:hypothetical protein